MLRKDSLTHLPGTGNFSPDIGTVFMLRKDSLPPPPGNFLLK
jgi:hypothetical protein